MILEAGVTKNNYPDAKHSREFTLEEGERLVGVKSQIDKGKEPGQSDVTFVIGRKA